MNTDKRDIQRRIVQALIDRRKTQFHAQDPRRPSAKALVDQAAFIAGAGAALQAAFGDSDKLTEYFAPGWMIDIIRSKLIDMDSLPEEN